jgi:hypothetical protein
MNGFRWLRILATAALAASVLTACTVSVQGGLIGGILSTFLVIFLFLTTASQQGCDDDDTKPDPDPEDAGAIDGIIGPCLSPIEPDGGLDMSIGPCLGAPQEDMGLDAQVGPCLSPPQQDAALDARIGPCLEAPLEDMGPDARIGPCLDIEADAARDAAPDAEIGPCLSPPLPEDGGAQIPKRRGPTALDHEAILARVLPGLPADIAARLGGPRDGKS